MMAIDFTNAASRAQALAAAKVHIGRSGQLIGKQSIQLHGGVGMTMEARIYHYFKVDDGRAGVW